MVGSIIRFTVSSGYVITYASSSLLTVQPCRSSVRRASTFKAGSRTDPAVTGSPREVGGLLFVFICHPLMCKETARPTVKHVDIQFASSRMQENELKVIDMQIQAGNDGLYHQGS